MSEILAVSFYVVAFIIELFIAGIVIKNKYENKTICEEIEKMNKRLTKLENG